MLDIKFIRENSEMVKKALKTRGADVDIEKLISLDEKRRAHIQETDELRARQNILSEEIAKTGGSERDIKIAESKELKKRLVETEMQLKTAEEEFSAMLRVLPNIPQEGWLVGKDERENAVLREVAASGELRPPGRGEKRDFGFEPRDYMVIAEQLDLIDIERAAKVSGSRFGYLKNEAVLLEMALVQLAFAHLAKKGFVPVIPPVLIKEEMMRGMGYVDSEKDKEERYFLEKDKMYLVGTSEQSIGPMHADEILNEDDLPKRYVGFSTCFRREAGSYGKDTHGILRVHQFDKVEMFIFARPEDSKGEHELMLACEEELMQSLVLPYRVVQLCTGDLSQPSAGTYDIEAWLPGQNKGEGQYRETHSTSNTTDYQARRLNVKIRRKDGTTEFAHLLNGTAFAIGRMIIAILENYQQEDGSVKIPEVLQPHMGGMKVIKGLA